MQVHHHHPSLLQYWMVFAGSRFTSGPESRYSPVEGEALGVAWALEKSKHFTLGCPNLYIAVDHRPLLKVLGDRHLEDISNPRLLNLKEKTLRYRFELVYVPGVQHKSPDAASRHPTGREEHMEIASIGLEEDGLSKVFLAGLRTQPDKEDSNMTLKVEQETLGTAMASLAALQMDTQISDKHKTPQEIGSMSSIKQVISWDRLESHSAGDAALSALVEIVNKGAPDHRETWPEKAGEFYRARSELSTIGPVVLYGERVVIPSSLHLRDDGKSYRQCVLARYAVRHREEERILHKLR